MKIPVYLVLIVLSSPTLATSICEIEDIAFDRLDLKVTYWNQHETVVGIEIEIPKSYKNERLTNAELVVFDQSGEEVNLEVPLELIEYGKHYYTNFNIGGLYKNSNVIVFYKDRCNGFRYTEVLKHHK